MNMHRAKQLLIESQRPEYNGAIYPLMDDYHCAHPDELPGCYVPPAVVYDAWSARLTDDQLRLLRNGDNREATITAMSIMVETAVTLGTWRVTQGIYRFDPDVYQAVVNTPLDGDIPGSLIERLPEWCVYIETPGLCGAGRIADYPIYGAWVRRTLEIDGLWYLVLTIDTDDRSPVSMPSQFIQLGGSLQQGIDRVIGSTSGDPLMGPAIRQYCEPILNLVLYLCSQNDYAGDALPTNPAPRKTRKKGLRMFQPDRETVWDVGVRMGSALRQARRQTQYDSEVSGRSVAPHIRRAHWHTVLSGKRKDDEGRVVPVEDRKRELRWMPPIPVNIMGSEAEFPATIRPVR